MCRRVLCAHVALCQYISVIVWLCRWKKSTCAGVYCVLTLLYVNTYLSLCGCVGGRKARVPACTVYCTHVALCQYISVIVWLCRWKKSTCAGVYCVLTLLYVMQLTTLVLYCFDSDDRNLDIDVCRYILACFILYCCLLEPLFMYH